MSMLLIKYKSTIHQIKINKMIQTLLYIAQLLKTMYFKKNRKLKIKMNFLKMNRIKMHKLHQLKRIYL